LTVPKIPKIPTFPGPTEHAQHANIPNMMNTPKLSSIAPLSIGKTGCANARPRSMWRRISVACLWAATMILTSAGPALAQEFVKVDDAAREQLPATPFVGVAYGFIWVAILGYLFVVARGLNRLQGELRDLRRRIDGAAGDGPANR
jgi:CcmD family protein